MIIFIRGLPRSGKTTISNKLAKKLRYEVIHVDSFKKELTDKNPKTLFIEEIVPYSYRKALEKVKNGPEDLERMRQQIENIKISGEIKIKNDSVQEAVDEIITFLTSKNHSL